MNGAPPGVRTVGPEPPQTAEKTFSESDKLARTPALAFGYHLPDRMTKDFFALTLLDPLIVSDESAKMYQALIKENQIASNVSGGFNYGLGNNFDYNGPMLYTFRVDYRPDLKGADVLKVVDKVISAIPPSWQTARAGRSSRGPTTRVSTWRTSMANG